MIKNQKGFIPIALILLVLLGIGGVYCLKTSQSKTIDQTLTPPALPSTTSLPIPTNRPAISWKTYTDDRYGFKFGYPSLYEVKKTEDNHIRLENPKNPFGEIIEIVVYEEEKNFDANRFINEIFYSYPGLTREMKEIWLKDLVVGETTIDGYRAFKINGLKNIAGDYGTGTFVNTKSYGLFILQITPPTLDNDGFYYNQILSTFKFTN